MGAVNVVVVRVISDRRRIATAKYDAFLHYMCMLAVLAGIRRFFDNNFLCPSRRHDQYAYRIYISVSSLEIFSRTRCYSFGDPDVVMRLSFVHHLDLRGCFQHLEHAPNANAKDALILAMVLGYMIDDDLLFECAARMSRQQIDDFGCVAHAVPRALRYPEL